MFRFRLWCAVLGLSLASAALAQDPPAAVAAAPAEAPVMETVLVTGEQPGPGLWKVSKGDHVLWILGAWSPLPAGMTWRSKQADELIAQSQEVLTTPRPSVELGFFRRLTLLPSLIGVRKNADGDKLEDVLPPDLYARWQVLKSATSAATAASSGSARCSPRASCTARRSSSPASA